ncbi:hypothetical protein Poly30_31060 [Planctomycetes bacterium Poly30]|uniref:Uncharacterized protein n=1 Tax=Saltatorellus ferox TaxID=2528018 RepID=A0A518EU16_9BACT|nr:hypothetical protein Poly30_31060 [Planctomycetes bacterium Poly30]
MLNLKLELKRGSKAQQVSLQTGLTRVGAKGARGIDIGIEGAAGELHVWDSPPKVVRVQGDDALIVSGESVDELLLQDGTEFAWAGVKFRFLDLPPVIEEIVEPEPARGAPSGGGTRPTLSTDPSVQRAWERVAAGLLVECGLADKSVTKRWQGAVMQNEWDADACAREILAASGGDLTNPKLLERAGRLERDLVMASFQRGIRGASRRARGAARSGAAFFVANVVAISVYSAIILALLILARVNYEWSLDGIIDRMVDAVTPG